MSDPEIKCNPLPLPMEMESIAIRCCRLSAAVAIADEYKLVFEKKNNYFFLSMLG
jgi:hypothetical protein